VIIDATLARELDPIATLTLDPYDGALGGSALVGDL
jgi:hypothetical protein